MVSSKKRRETSRCTSGPERFWGSASWPIGQSERSFQPSGSVKPRNGWRQRSVGSMTRQSELLTRIRILRMGLTDNQDVFKRIPQINKTENMTHRQLQTHIIRIQCLLYMYASVTVHFSVAHSSFTQKIPSRRILFNSS